MKRKHAFFIVLFSCIGMVMIPITAGATIFEIDPAQSSVYYDFWFSSGSAERYALSGTLSFDRIDGYLGVPEWSQVHLEAINIQPSALPHGPLTFPDEYHGAFVGSIFSGNTNPCSYWRGEGGCFSTGNFSYLSGTLNEEIIDITGSAALDLYHSYFFTIKATAPVPEPSTMLLLGSGLIGLAGFRNSFRKGEE